MPPKNSLKKFCSLSKFLEQKDPELLAVFDDLCVQYLLRPARGSNGVTFIHPTDKSYRKKIIDGAYSSDPSPTLLILKSLILQDYYPSPTSFGSNVVNLLNQKLNIVEASEKSVKLDKGLELVINKSFVPFNRENMAVYTLNGKGEIPLNGTVVAVEKKMPKMGGYSSSSSTRKDLCQKIEKIYIGEIGKSENIYVKKVVCQLLCIKEHGKEHLDKVSSFLGNDEFSDSYLLDMFCEKYEISKCCEAVMGMLDNSEKLEKCSVAKYVELREEMIAVKVVSTSEEKPSDRVNGIRSPMDIREKDNAYYKDEQERLGKDLFIVFSNINRDVWQTEPSQADKEDSFKNYSFLASRVYTCCNDILKQGFDAARDLTLYGNLLKSDVFKFVPQPSYSGSTIVSIPSPLDMNIYSLSNFINKPVSGGVSGGSDKYAYLFEGL